MSALTNIIEETDGESEITMSALRFYAGFYSPDDFAAWRYYGYQVPDGRVPCRYYPTSMEWFGEVRGDVQVGHPYHTVFALCRSGARVQDSIRERHRREAIRRFEALKGEVGK